MCEISGDEKEGSPAKLGRLKINFGVWACSRIIVCIIAYWHMLSMVESGDGHALLARKAMLEGVTTGLMAERGEVMFELSTLPFHGIHILLLRRVFTFIQFTAAPFLTFRKLDAVGWQPLLDQSHLACNTVKACLFCCCVDWRWLDLLSVTSKWTNQDFPR